jgi:probable DNA metabolism protein
MSRYAGAETHKLHGFVRFAQTKSGVLYSEIAPVNDVLYFVALHFTERLISEAWVIHDVKRSKAAVYNAQELVITETGGHSRKSDDNISGSDYSIRENSGSFADLIPDEERFQDLFIDFLDAVAIKERVNPKLQRQLMPNRYRPYMTEFTQKITKKINVNSQSKCNSGYDTCVKY